MNNLLTENLLKIIHQGDNALMKELGPAGYIRYIEQFDQGGNGDYTEDRKQMPFYQMSLDEIKQLIQ